MLISRECPLTGKTNTMELPITNEQIDKWMNKRGLAQNAFPSCTPGQREFLISGITPKMWRETFGEGDQ